MIKWFAERADMIIIMFDAHKLDISDELKSVLDVLKPHQDKVRVLLNKADTIDAQVDATPTTTHPPPLATGPTTTTPTPTLCEWYHWMDTYMYPLTL